MRLAAPVLAVLALASAAAAATGGLTTVVYERTLMREAGARCKLFEPRLQTALSAGALQARGAALRAGATLTEVRLTEGQATARSLGVACGSGDLSIAAQRVRAAFLGWSRQATLDLPGGRGAWKARRWPDRPQPFWALSTPLRLADRPAMLGFRKERGSKGPAGFALETQWAEAGQAYSARLVLRDPTLAADPYLARDGAPPEGASLAISASGKLALDGGGAWRFRFPDAAADALARLDPRENARLELVIAGPGGDRTVSALVEAGDFAVGRAFLSAGP